MPVDDGVQGGTATFGLHARARTDWYGIEANLLLPDHIRDTGAFSFQFLGQQQLTRNLSVETQLYRLWPRGRSEPHPGLEARVGLP